MHASNLQQERSHYVAHSQLLGCGGTVIDFNGDLFAGLGRKSDGGPISRWRTNSYFIKSLDVALLCVTHGVAHVVGVDMFPGFYICIWCMGCKKSSSRANHYSIN